MPVTQAATATIDLERANAQLEGRDALEIIRWADRTFGEGLILTSSFGVQAAVMLHLATRVRPDIPVVFIDTGFHFPETYRFADALTQRLNLNLKVYQSDWSPARMVAIKGRLWEQDADGLNEYDRIRKIEPMQRALKDLGASAWLAGLRRKQTDHRATLRYVERQGDIHKVHPILDWSTRQIHEYLKQYDLPYHPLHEHGYASIGDWHSTTPITADAHERAGRFQGLKQECGLHLPLSEQENQSRESSGL